MNFGIDFTCYQQASVTEGFLEAMYLSTLAAFAEHVSRISCLLAVRSIALRVIITSSSNSSFSSEL